MTTSEPALLSSILLLHRAGWLEDCCKTTLLNRRNTGTKAHADSATSSCPLLWLVVTLEKCGRTAESDCLLLFHQTYQCHRTTASSSTSMLSKAMVRTAA
nr:hypothetical protein CFP56_08033 [Quercus suber]